MSLALILVAAQPHLQQGKGHNRCLEGQGCPLLIALEKQCKSRNETEQNKTCELGC